jgi:hypothetical protein
VQIHNRNIFEVGMSSAWTGFFISPCLTFLIFVASDDQTDNQPDTGCGKSITPSISVSQVSGHKIANKGADIDAHVKDIVGIIF